MRVRLPERQTVPSSLPEGPGHFLHWMLPGRCGIRSSRRGGLITARRAARSRCAKSEIGPDTPFVGLIFH
jgi:hypothetical protein